MAGYGHIVRPPREEGAIARLERLTGESIDRIEEVVSIPLAEVLQRKERALLLNQQSQYVRAVLTTMTRIGLERDRLTADHERLLAEMREREFGSRAKVVDAEPAGD